jgi:hypothetical protein
MKKSVCEQALGMAAGTLACWLRDRSRVWVLAVAIVAVLTGASSVWAGTKFVNGTASGANNGTSWTDAYTSLASALANVSDNDQVWVAQGTYTEGMQLTVANSGVTITGGFTNGMTELSQRDSANFVVKVDGNLSYRCFNITAANVTLDGLTIQRGNIAGFGGGIYNAGSGLTVQSCIITNCTTASAPGDNHAGSGIYSKESMAVLNSSVVNNKASTGGNGYGGGGIYFDSTGTLLVSNTVFQANIAQDANAGDPSYGAGGAIHMAQNGQLDALNCIFDGNAVLHDEAGKEHHRGGAIYLKGNSGAGRVVNCTFYTNNVVKGYGGAIYSAGAPLAITNSIFWGNTRGYQTTGRQIYSSGSVSIDYACLPGTGTDEVYASGTLTVNHVITNDPLFANAAGHDLHLKSRGGRWTGSGWVTDAVLSPCIDAGNPASAYDNEPAYNGGRINLGAYGNTVQASKTAADTAISNGSVTYIPGQTMATLNGMLTYTGAAPAEVWVYWGKTDGTNNEAQWANTNYFGTNTSALPAAYSTNVTVELNTTYYYAYKSANTYGTNWATPSATFFTIGIPPKMTIQAIDANAAELGSDPGVFTISGDSNMLTNLPLTVYYTISGTAGNGGDYTTIPSSVTIPAGSTNISITISPRYDTSVEGDETVTLTLVSDPLYTFVSPATATMTIADNPMAGVIVYVDKNAVGGVNDGTSWANACTNFDSAVAYVANGGAIWAAKGTYVAGSELSVTTPNISVYGGFAGNETLFLQRDIAANPTKLDGQKTRRLLNVSSTNVTIDGLTLTQGWITSGMGAAIANTGTGLLVKNCILNNNEVRTSSGDDGGAAIGSSVSMTVQDCLFIGNTNTVNNFGGAIYLTGGSLLVERSHFILNHNADSYSGTYGNGCGGAIHIKGGNLTARNCSFVGNTTDAAGGNLRGSHGGAVYFGNATVSLLENCTFYANRSIRVEPSCGGGAMYIYNAGAVVGVTNCIFWQNVSASGVSSASITNNGTLNLGYCDIDVNGITGGTLNYGTGIINVDPLFASTSMPYDMHLQSKYGRWSSGGWVNDTVTSPCIDAGDPASSYSLETDYNGERINLGAYGNTPQASRSKRTGGTLMMFQ